MTNSPPITVEQARVLRQYAHTTDGLFMQGIKGASELFSQGFLDWHGQQYGTHFYSITETGRAALGFKLVKE